MKMDPTNIKASRGRASAKARRFLNFENDIVMRDRVRISRLIAEGAGSTANISMIVSRRSSADLCSSDRAGWRWPTPSNQRAKPVTSQAAPSPTYDTSGGRFSR